MRGLVGLVRVAGSSLLITSETSEMTLNSASITDRGLVVGNELESVTGRLGWSALRAHSPLDAVRAVAKITAGPS
jgi:hypothetical protein